MTAGTADYYGFLGLTSDATLADVKKAYRQLARQHHPDRNRPGPAAPPRTDVGRPDGYFEPASRVLTMLEETWQAIRAHNPEIPPVVIIIASGTTGRDARRGRFDSQRWTVHTTGTPDKDPSHSDHPSHTSSRVVRRTSTSPMADAAA